MARSRKKKSKKGKSKYKITLLELVAIEAAARRRVWIEQGCPRFKNGVQSDRKKEKSRKACRGKINPSA